MRKYVFHRGIGILLLGIVLVLSGCDTSVIPSTGQSEISSLEKGVSDKCLPAPAVASLLLKEAGYHKGGEIGNYIKNVANEMGPGTDFHGIDKCDENYAYVVAVFLIGQGAQVNIPNPVYNETKNLYYETIQEAIDDAGNGNKIFICPGTYNENVVFNNKNITVQSTNPSEPAIVAATIIDGGGSGHVVVFDNGDTSTLAGFTIRNGNESDGGGIDIHYSSPTITGNTITNNEGFYAGGIRIYYSNSTNITGNTITNNDAQYGGGISIYASCATVIGNTITGNTATSRAGGIYITGIASGSPTIENNTITGNTAAVYGGGICLSGGLDTSNPTIIGNTITGNTAGYRGGGIFANLNRNILPADNRPTGWGIGRENIPIGDPLVPVEGVTYTIADNEFLGNEHGTPLGTPLDYTEGAHVYFDE